MNCSQCGNEIQPDEIFCGQCGTATISSGSPTKRMSSMSLSAQDVTTLDNQQSPQIGGSYAVIPPKTPSYLQMRYLFSPPSALFTSRYSAHETPGAQQESGDRKPQQSEFYQHPTEVIARSASDSMLGRVNVSSQQAWPELQAAKDLSALRQAKRSLYLPSSSLPGDHHKSLSRLSHSGQEYSDGRPLKLTVPSRSQKQHSSGIVLIVSLCIIIVLVSSIALTVFFFRGSLVNTGSVSPTPTVQPTVEPTATPTPQDTPTPTAVPTPLPDAGFTWCGPNCTNYGFSVEYPVGWQLGGTAANNGIQFTNPAQPDQTATFKTLGVTSGSAGDLLNSELQANFMTKSGYVPPQGTGVTTLGGGTWLATTVYYQSVDQQREHVAIYTIVYRSKGYLIEIQAPDPNGQQFTPIYNTYYAAMLSKFSFVS